MVELEARFEEKSTGLVVVVASSDGLDTIELELLVEATVDWLSADDGEEIAPITTGTAKVLELVLREVAAKPEEGVVGVLLVVPSSGGGLEFIALRIELDIKELMD